MVPPALLMLGFMQAFTKAMIMTMMAKTTGIRSGDRQKLPFSYLVRLATSIVDSQS